MRRQIAAHMRPGTNVVLPEAPARALRHVEPLDHPPGAGQQVVEEGRDGLDVAAEIEGVRGVEERQRFEVDLSADSEDAGRERDGGGEAVGCRAGLAEEAGGEDVIGGAAGWGVGGVVVGEGGVDV